MKKIQLVLITLTGLLFWQCQPSTEEIQPLIAGTQLQEIKVNNKTNELFLYDANNRLVEYQTFFDDGTNVWESRRYTWKNNLVVRMEYWSAHAMYLSSWPTPGKPMALQNIETYEYDTQNRLIKTNGYINEKEGLRWYELLSYDAQGRKAKKQFYSPDGQATSTETFTYDQQNNVTKWGSSYWTYDDRPNPYSFLNVPASFNPSWASPNNATSNYGIDAQGTKYNTWIYEYSYDPKTNLPITAKINMDNKALKLLSFIYR